MAYIGRSVEIGMFEKQVLTADSSTTTFTLSFAVGSANSLMVVYGGVLQEPAVAYSVSGGGQQIVFSEAPATGTTTYIIYLGKQLTTPRAAGQETTKQTFSGDGSTVTFTLTDPPVVPAGIMVFVDGILQREGSGNNYVSSGSTITFTSAPDSSAEIDVYTLVKEKVSIDTVADGSITFAKLVAGSPTWNGAGETVIATASSGNSLRITNTGSGNSLLVEDSASTDSSPFVITAAGDVGIGTTSPTTKLSVADTSTNCTITVTNSASNFQVQSNSNDGYFNLNGSGNIIFRSGTPSVTERARIDSSGNLGLGVTPSAWGTSNKAIDVASYVSFGYRSATNGTVISNNSYLTSGDIWTYKNTAAASAYQQIGGVHYWSVAASGTAGTTVTGFNSAVMVLDSSGSLQLGTTAAQSFVTLRKDTTAGTISGTPSIMLTNSNSANSTYMLGGLFASGYRDIYGATPVVPAGIWFEKQPFGGGASTDGAIVFGAMGGDVALPNTLPSERMRITRDGNLLVGTTTALGKLTVNGTVSSSYTGFYIGEQTYRMQVASGQIQVIASSGGVYLPSGGTGWGSLSDENLKNITGLITNGIDAVKSLRAARYTWKSDETNKPQVGLIAQDIRAVLPEAVDENSDGFLGVRYSDVIPLLVAAIQELKAIVDVQAVEIAALKAK